MHFSVTVYLLKTDARCPLLFVRRAVFAVVPRTVANAVFLILVLYPRTWLATVPDRTVTVKQTTYFYRFVILSAWNL